MTPVMLLFLASVALFAALAAWLLQPSRSGKSGPALLVYGAASLRGPLTAVAQAYEREFGQTVHLTFGGSGTLLANIEITRTGDLFIPADESYVELARAKQLVHTQLRLAHMQAVLAVARSNPKRILSLSDLARPDLRLSMANPEAAAIGQVMKDNLTRAGWWDPIQPRIAVFKPTVTDVANDIKLGTVDAGFIWDTLLPLYPELEPAPVALPGKIRSHITAVVLQTSRISEDALRFAEYLRDPDHGLKEWQRQGFSTGQEE